MTMTRVGNVMAAAPVLLKPDMNVYEAAATILKHKVSGAPVVDGDGQLVGMLSELDCLRAIVVSAYDGGDPGGALVSDVMTPEVEVNNTDDDIIAVARSMLEHKHRRRPVLENGQLVGQLTCRQILTSVTRMLESQEPN